MPNNVAGVSIWIERDGILLPEYGTTVLEEEETHKTISESYVESLEGASFAIAIGQNTGPGQQPTNLSVTLEIDGHFVDSYFAHQFCTTNAPLLISNQHQHGTSTVRPFKFKKVALTDDDYAANMDERTLKSLGQIKLFFNRVGVSETTLFTQPAVRTPQREDKPLLIHERSKKASITHSFEFGICLHHSVVLR